MTPSLLGPRIVAAVLIVGGAVLIYQAFQVGQSTGYNVVGPSTFPLAVSASLSILGAVLALRTTVRPDEDLADLVAEEERSTHWRSVGLLVLALVAYAFALNGARLGPLDVPALGYIVATGLFVPLAAWVIGSNRIVRDVIAGFALAIVIYIGFTQFLGVRLPAGPLGIFG